MWETLFSMLIASTPGGLESRLACEVGLSETAGADGVKQSTQHSSRIGKRSDPHREKGKTVEGEFTSVDSLNSSSSAFSAEVSGDAKVLGGVNARVECAQESAHVDYVASTVLSSDVSIPCDSMPGGALGKGSAGNDSAPSLCDLDSALSGKTRPIHQSFGGLTPCGRNQPHSEMSSLATLHEVPSNSMPDLVDRDSSDSDTPTSDLSDCDTEPYLGFGFSSISSQSTQSTDSQSDDSEIAFATHILGAMLGHHPVLSQEEFESAESQSASSDSTHNSIEKTIEEQDDSDSHSKLSADDSSSDSEPKLTYSPTDLAAMERAARTTRDIRMRHLEMLAHYAEAEYENRVAPEDMGLYDSDSDGAYSYNEGGVYGEFGDRSSESGVDEPNPFVSAAHYIFEPLQQFLPYAPPLYRGFSSSERTNAEYSLRFATMNEPEQCARKMLMHSIRTHALMKSVRTFDCVQLCYTPAEMADMRRNLRQVTNTSAYRAIAWDVSTQRAREGIQNIFTLVCSTVTFMYLWMIAAAMAGGRGIARGVRGQTRFWLAALVLLCGASIAFAGTSAAENILSVGVSGGVLHQMWSLHDHPLVTWTESH
jgi:hypothetical protein